MKRKKVLVISVLLLIITSITIIGVSFAKYAKDSVWNYYLKSQGFYLSSDDLTTEKNVNNLWDGNNVSFNIKNSLNKEMITDYDINYNVVCNVLKSNVKDAKCILNNSDSNTFNGVLSANSYCLNDGNDGVDVSSYPKSKCEVEGYKWITQSVVNDLEFNVVGSEDVVDAEVEIVLTSTKPYKQIISGTFVLHKEEEKTDNYALEVNKYLNHYKLVLTSLVDGENEVNIKWDSNKIRVDVDAEQLSNYEVDSNGYINEMVVNVAGNGTLTYDFYLVDKSLDTSTDDFTITG